MFRIGETHVPNLTLYFNCVFFLCYIGWMYMCMFMCLSAGTMAQVSLLSTLFETLLTVECYILICDFSVTYRLIGSQASGSSLVSVSHLPVSCATMASFHVGSQYSSSGHHAVLQGFFSLSHLLSLQCICPSENK